MCQQTSEKPAHGPFRTPKSSPWRLPGASPSTLPAALGPPEELPGAAKPRICKRLQREHQLRPPSQSTWYSSPYAAPPALNLPLTLPAHTVLAYPLPQGLPPRRTMGVGGFDWAAPTAADPEKRILRSAI